MKFDVEKKFTLELTEQEAKDIAGDLFNYVNGYRGGNSGASRELLAWLGSRNEEKPSGDLSATNSKTDPTENW